MFCWLATKFLGGWNILVHYVVFNPFPGYCKSLANVPARVDKTSSQNICSKRRTKLPRRIEDYEGFRYVCFNKYQVSDEDAQ